MDRFYLNNNKVIPVEYLSDTKKLRKFIMRDMRIKINLADTYLLWKHISTYEFNTPWIKYGFYPFDTPLDTFLRDRMKKYGCVMYY